MQETYHGTPSPIFDGLCEAGTGAKKSPCFGCEREFMDKSDSQCVYCEKRITAATGRRPPAAPARYQGMRPIQGGYGQKGDRVNDPGFIESVRKLYCEGRGLLIAEIARKMKSTSPTVGKTIRRYGMISVRDQRLAREREEIEALLRAGERDVMVIMAKTGAAVDVVRDVNVKCGRPAGQLKNWHPGGKTPKKPAAPVEG